MVIAIVLATVLQEREHIVIIDVLSLRVNNMGECGTRRRRD